MTSFDFYDIDFKDIRSYLVHHKIKAATRKNKKDYITAWGFLEKGYFDGASDIMYQYFLINVALQANHNVGIYTMEEIANLDDSEFEELVKILNLPNIDFTRKDVVYILHHMNKLNKEDKKQKETSDINLDDPESLSTLPNDVLRRLLLTSSYESLISLCATSKKINNLCHKTKEIINYLAEAKTGFDLSGASPELIKILVKYVNRIRLPAYFAGFYISNDKLHYYKGNIHSNIVSNKRFKYKENVNLVPYFPYDVVQISSNPYDPNGSNYVLTSDYKLYTINSDDGSVYVYHFDNIIQLVPGRDYIICITKEGKVIFSNFKHFMFNDIKERIVKAVTVDAYVFALTESGKVYKQNSGRADAMHISFKQKKSTVFNLPPSIRIIDMCSNFWTVGLFDLLALIDSDYNIHWYKMAKNKYYYQPDFVYNIGPNKVRNLHIANVNIENRRYRSELFIIRYDGSVESNTIIHQNENILEISFNTVVINHHVLEISSGVHEKRPKPTDRSPLFYLYYDENNGEQISPLNYDLIVSSHDKKTLHKS